MSDYTPSTDEVRETYSITVIDGAVIPDRAAEFGRWIAAHDESVRAEERERIARNIEAALPGPDEPGDGWVYGMENAARIVREGA